MPRRHWCESPAGLQRRVDARRGGGIEASACDVVKARVSGIGNIVWRWHWRKEKKKGRLSRLPTCRHRADNSLAPPTLMQPRAPLAAQPRTNTTSKRQHLRLSSAASVQLDGIMGPCELLGPGGGGRTRGVGHTGALSGAPRCGSFIVLGSVTSLVVGKHAASLAETGIAWLLVVSEPSHNWFPNARERCTHPPSVRRSSAERGYVSVCACFVSRAGPGKHGKRQIWAGCAGLDRVSRAKWWAVSSSPVGLPGTLSDLDGSGPGALGAACVEYAEQLQPVAIQHIPSAVPTGDATPCVESRHSVSRELLTPSAIL